MKFLFNSVEPRDVHQHKESLEIKDKLELDLDNSKLTLEYQAWPKYTENESDGLVDEDFDETPESSLENLNEESSLEVNDEPIMDSEISPKTRKEEKNFSMLVCETCNFVAESKRGLTNHIKSHRTCENCGEFFYGPKAKREHASHFRKCTKIKPTCPACGKVFNYPSGLRLHLEARSLTCAGGLRKPPQKSS